ncbi:Gfo/Idh/MocA family protein [Phycicoccus sp. Soil802]|uniref:Gfo/Idh/MocA family protein n=1 Tax=Phycicoccus sp. Soil802 TaxID=1736414 RepID=UPI00070273C6|nr:Gfo/Idh/MocA family oxidoreductase [Phycicoccus sp. Soil802]KRF28303.1 oxidoreductase [Phycicoccus sp. Soil802]
MPSLTLPTPRTPDPHDAPALRWGILAPGGIAHSFATALRAASGQQLQAVASRSLPRAQAFADEFGVTAAYGAYDELVADPDVDVVYVASPHSEHRAQAMLATAAGKPVLVEKAFARNATEAREIFESASAAGVFAMEAMWTRFLPHIDVVRRCLEDGLLGEVHTVHADHGQRLYPNGPARLSEPSLAGGAMLDLGIYPVSFAHFVLGDFVDVTASGRRTDKGVDSQASIGVTSSRGAMGVLGTTMLTKTPTTAAVCGTEARLEIDGDFYAPKAVVRLVGNDGTELDRFTNADTQHGLHFEAAEVARQVSAGASESPLLPWAETLTIMDALDDVRAQIGVRFPGE